MLLVWRCWCVVGWRNFQAVEEPVSYTVGVWLLVSHYLARNSSCRRACVVGVVLSLPEGDEIKLFEYSRHQASGGAPAKRGRLFAGGAALSKTTRPFQLKLDFTRGLKLFGLCVCCQFQMYVQYADDWNVCSANQDTVEGSLINLGTTTSRSGSRKTARYLLR